MDIPHRTINVINKRQESIKRWQQSETAKAKMKQDLSEFKISFENGSMLLAAVSSLDTEETKRLISIGADVNFANVDGLTALHQACIDENIELVQLLLHNKADINARDNECWTPLHAAASTTSLEVTQYLVEHGADLAAVNTEGELPLDLAEEEDIVDYLREQTDLKNINLEEARSYEHRMMLTDVNNWINKKIDASKVLDPQGATPLHVAAAKGYMDILKLLVEKTDIDIDCRDADGWTALHAAVYWKQERVIEYLITNSADAYAKTHIGLLPIDLAEGSISSFYKNQLKKVAGSIANTGQSTISSKNGENITTTIDTTNYPHISKKPLAPSIKTNLQNKTETTSTNNTVKPPSRPNVPAPTISNAILNKSTLSSTNNQSRQINTSQLPPTTAPLPKTNPPPLPQNNVASFPRMQNPSLPSSNTQLFRTSPPPLPSTNQPLLPTTAPLPKTPATNTGSINVASRQQKLPVQPLLPTSIIPPFDFKPNISKNEANKIKPDLKPPGKSVFPQNPANSTTNVVIKPIILPITNPVTTRVQTPPLPIIPTHKRVSVDIPLTKKLETAENIFDNLDLDEKCSPTVEDNPLLPPKVKPSANKSVDDIVSQIKNRSSDAIIDEDKKSRICQLAHNYNSKDNIVYGRNSSFSTNSSQPTLTKMDQQRDRAMIVLKEELENAHSKIKELTNKLNFISGEYEQLKSQTSRLSEIENDANSPNQQQLLIEKLTKENKRLQSENTTLIKTMTQIGRAANTLKRDSNVSTTSSK